MKKIILILFVLFTAFAFAQEKKETIEEKVEEKVEKLAEFPGGINEFRNQFTKVFRADKIKEKGIVKTVILFVIEKDGSVIDVKALGGSQSLNDESIRAIKKIKGTWIPAEINGETVRYRYRLPLSMNFL
jgi:protein TonB